MRISLGFYRLYQQLRPLSEFPRILGSNYKTASHFSKIQEVAHVYRSLWLGYEPRSLKES